MSRSIRVLVALAVGLSGLAFSTPSLAADNSTLPVCGSCAASETFANKDIGGVKFPKHILHNGSGTEVGTQAAPLYFGFGTGITLPAFASTPTFNLGTLNGAATAANQTAAAAAKGEGATGAAVPSGAQYMGLNVSGNLTGWTAKAGNTYSSTDVVPGVAVVNTNNNGQAAASSSAPVVVAKNSGTGSTVAGAAVGTAGTASSEVVTVQGIASMTPFLTNPQAATTGGCTPAKTLSAASTNATNIKASAGTLCKMITINTTATLYYLKMYDKATAPTCNSDTVLATYPVPPSNGGVAVPLGPFGEAYTAGIGFCLTAALADNDNTSAATGVTIAYSYK